VWIHLLPLQLIDGASDVSGLIGRKYPRRRKPLYRPRVHEIVDECDQLGVDACAAEYTRQIALEAQAAASLEKDWEITFYLMQSGQDKLLRLAELEARIMAIEDMIAEMLDEEDFITIIAMTH
jgi:hypothetical protein